MPIFQIGSLKENKNTGAVSGVSQSTITRTNLKGITAGKLDKDGVNYDATNGFDDSNRNYTNEIVVLGAGQLFERNSKKSFATTCNSAKRYMSYVYANCWKCFSGSVNPLDVTVQTINLWTDRSCEKSVSYVNGATVKTDIDPKSWTGNPTNQNNPS